MRFANVLWRFVGLVFGLFVCAMFVTALFCFGFGMFVCRGAAPIWFARGSVGLVFGLFVCALFVAALFSGLLGARSPHRDFQGSLSTSGFVRFVGSVFGLFVYALFVMALFFFGFGLVGCRVSMFLANIFVRFVVFEDVRQPGACT
jgi:hypothetical protein